MRGVGNRLHFGGGEVRFETAPLLREDAAGRSDLDHVRAVLAGEPHFRRAFDRAGAGEARIEQLVDLGAEAIDVAVAADDRQRRASRNNARPRHHALGRPAAQREGGVTPTARFAHSGEPGQRGDARVLGTDHDAPFVRLGRFLPEIAARIAGQVSVEVDQARQHGLGLEVDLAVGGHGTVAGSDRHDPAIGDEDRGSPGRFGSGISDHRACADRDGLGRERRRHQRAGQRQPRHQPALECLHDRLSPCLTWPGRLMARPRRQGKRSGENRG